MKGGKNDREKCEKALINWKSDARSAPLSLIVLNPRFSLKIITYVSEKIMA